MKVAIIENADYPEIAEFMEDETGKRLLFDSYDEAEDWLMSHAESGTAYAKWGGD